jgi:hypothetical protein
MKLLVIATCGSSPRRDTASRSSTDENLRAAKNEWGEAAADWSRGGRADQTLMWNPRATRSARTAPTSPARRGEARPAGASRRARQIPELVRSSPRAPKRIRWSPSTPANAGTPRARADSSTCSAVSATVRRSTRALASHAAGSAPTAGALRGPPPHSRDHAAPATSPSSGARSAQRALRRRPAPGADLHAPQPHDRARRRAPARASSVEPQRLGRVSCRQIRHDHR